MWLPLSSQASIKSFSDFIRPTVSVCGSRLDEAMITKLINESEYEGWLYSSGRDWIATAFILEPSTVTLFETNMDWFEAGRLLHKFLLERGEQLRIPYWRTIPVPTEPQLRRLAMQAVLGVKSESDGSFVFKVDHGTLVDYLS